MPCTVSLPSRCRRAAFHARPSRPERVRQSTGQPFEGSMNAVPVTALSRTIEIELRELLGEADVPPLGPVDDVLLLLHVAAPWSCSM